MHMPSHRLLALAVTVVLGSVAACAPEEAPLPRPVDCEYERLLDEAERWIRYDGTGPVGLNIRSATVDGRRYCWMDCPYCDMVSTVIDCDGHIVCPTDGACDPRYGIDFLDVSYGEILFVER